MKTKQIRVAALFAFSQLGLVACTSEYSVGLSPKVDKQTLSTVESSSSGGINPTPSSTSTESSTTGNENSVVVVNTHTETTSHMATSSEVSTSTSTNLTSSTATFTDTSTNTNTNSVSELSSNTDVIDEVIDSDHSQTNGSDSQCSEVKATLCCNLKSKSENFIVPASKMGCNRGSSLVAVLNKEECEKLRSLHQKSHNEKLHDKKKIDLVFVVDESADLEKNKRDLRAAFKLFHEKLAIDANDYQIKIVDKKTGRHSSVKNKPKESLYGFIDSICGNHASIAIGIPKNEQHHSCGRKNAALVVVELHKNHDLKDKDHSEVKIAISGKETALEKYDFYSEKKSIEHVEKTVGKELRIDFD